MAEAKTMIAETGTAELHNEPSAFGISAPGWVALSMLVVIGIMLWQKVPALVARLLDSRIDHIKAQLEEASKLRAEAEALLAKAKAQQAASAGDAQAIIAHAQQEASDLIAEAEKTAGDLTVRRAKMAEDKIAAAERAALAEVRAKAAEAATSAAAKLIAERHDAGTDKALVDRTIAGLSRVH
ncbi:hypothetical protein ACFSCW_09935 [Sphingomonas tabacisoli]|uniref:ATP synthase subunit b n=1 Tax=Sphingomonas tabacisoli TaxID=2249466 RepID=A0ABW4I2G1_9SPHN